MQPIRLVEAAAERRENRRLGPQGKGEQTVVMVLVSLLFVVLAAMAAVWTARRVAEWRDDAEQARERRRAKLPYR
jgi:hypothetical protein